MRWLLSVPNDFFLQETLRCSRIFLCGPTTITGFGDRLERVEQLSTQTVALLVIYQSTSGLFISTDSALSGSEVEEASERIWRMLRLSEDHRCLGDLLHGAGINVPLRCHGSRLIRGTTSWEDLVVSALASWREPHGLLDLSRVQALVDYAGPPLPRNPTRHAFPGASDLLGRQHGLEPLLGRAMAVRVAALARAWHAHARYWQRWQVEVLESSPERAAELVRLLCEEFGLHRYAASFLLMRLGRYDILPNVLGLPDRLRDGLADGPLLEVFSAYRAWAGLIYWLIDWEDVSVMDEMKQPPTNGL